MPATIAQTHFRWYADDHALGTGENPLADQDANPAVVVGTNYRLRLEIAGSGSGIPPYVILSARLEFSENGGDWTAIGARGATPVFYSDSPYFADNAQTAVSLLSPSNTYQAGYAKDAGATASSVAVGEAGYTEYVWNLSFSAAAAGKTYSFRVTNNGGTFIYSVTPQVQVSPLILSRRPPMGYLLKQSSTNRPLLFLMVDVVDHLSGKTGLSPTVTLSKDGGAFGSPSGAVTEVGNGWYKVAGNATDTGTFGPLLLHATATGADPCDDRFEVVAFDPDTTGAGGLPVVGAGTNNFKSDASANVTIGGYASNQDPLTQVTGGSNTIAVDSTHKVSVPTTQKVDLVDSPNATAIGHIQSGLATAAGQTSILNAVNAVTTNTARSMPVVPSFFVRPTSGSTAYQVMLYLYNLQGILEDADNQAITIHARTATGTSRDTNLNATTMTRVAAGKYTATYTVASTHAQEAVYFDFTWAISSTSMADSGAAEVQDAESLATLTAVKSQTDKLSFDGSNHVKSSPQTAVTLTSDYDAAKSAAQAGDPMTLAADDLNTIAAEVWAVENRTLSGTSGANAPSAATSQADIYTTAFKNGTVRLCARVYKDGADIQPSDAATVVYSVFLLDDQDPDARTAVTGHTGVSLNAADVIFDTLESDVQASDYNFRHVVPIGVHPAFTIAGRNYLAEYTITPVAGEKIILRFRVHVL